LGHNFRTKCNQCFKKVFKKLLTSFNGIKSENVVQVIRYICISSFLIKLLSIILYKFFNHPLHPTHESHRNMNKAVVQFILCDEQNTGMYRCRLWFKVKVSMNR
jgi:hypothetical protein